MSNLSVPSASLAGLCILIALTAMIQRQDVSAGRPSREVLVEVRPDLQEYIQPTQDLFVLCCPIGQYRCPSRKDCPDYCCDLNTTCKNGGCERCICDILPPMPTYCRPSTYLSITVDNYLDALYYDGVSVYESQLYTANTPRVGRFFLPGTVRLLALHATNANLYSLAGILASDGLGWLLTNSSWNCIRNTTVTSADWMMPGYTANWPSAVMVGPNGARPWMYHLSIYANASWIWTTQGYSTQQSIYCRVRLNCTSNCSTQSVTTRDPWTNNGDIFPIPSAK